MSDKNNLLVRYGIVVNGSTEPVELINKGSKVTLVFTGVHALDAMQKASRALIKAIPTELSSDVTFDASGSVFNVTMPVSTYRELTQKKIGGGMAR